MRSPEWFVTFWVLLTKRNQIAIRLFVVKLPKFILMSSSLQQESSFCRTVLITGASGYIGFHTACAIRRAGHRVFGLVRSEAQAKKLTLHEIIPVIGNQNDVSSYSTALLESEVIIDMVQDYSNSDSMTANKTLLTEIRRVADTLKQKKRYIYTSGTLLYGESGDKIVDESSPLKCFPQHPRRLFEESVVLLGKSSSSGNTEASYIETAVIRPTFVYGNACGQFLGEFFDWNRETNTVVVKGNPDRSWGWVHVDDLADAYRRVVEAESKLVNGEVFNAADGVSHTMTYSQARLAFAKSNGAPDSVAVEYRPAGEDPWSKMMNVKIMTTGEKLRTRLSWKPTHGAVLSELPFFSISWKAAHAQLDK